MRDAAIFGFGLAGAGFAIYTLGRGEPASIKGKFALFLVGLSCCLAASWASLQGAA